MAALGTPEALGDWDWAKAVSGSIAAKKGIMNFMG
jgi:hypothetical protein